MLEGMGDNVMSVFAKSLREIESRILGAAQANAVAHFHSIGAKPGLYLAGFQGGVKEGKSSVVGYVRNSNQLAHLLEYGFTISDLMIAADEGVMKFLTEDVGTVYRREIHRHETQVQAYPALGPAFDAHKGEVAAAAEDAVTSATAKVNK